MLINLRKKIRYILFKNYHSLTVNIIYLLFEKKAKRKFKNLSYIDENISNSVKSFQKNGYLLIQPPSNSKSLNLTDLQKKINEEFDNLNNTIILNNGLIKLKEGLNRFPEIINFIDKEVESILELYFKSNFKIYSASFYRIVPTGDDPNASFLWHVDNCPAQEIKLMIYLDDVDKNLGALTIKNRTTSDKLIKSGFSDRNKNKKYIDVLNNNNTSIVCEGKIGSRILFENGKCLHKATSPKYGHRDVVNLVIIPSIIPWYTHYSRNKHLLNSNAGICLNPFTDKPELVGFQY